MADSTYTGIWDRYEKLKRSYYSLAEGALSEDSTLAQYAGSDRLNELVNELDRLLDDSSELINEHDRRKIQATIIPLLLRVEEAFADACLFECDPAASFEDYVYPRIYA